MKILLDNNLPPAWAEGLHALSQREPNPVEVVALRTKFKASTPDIDWLSALEQEGGWAIISSDRFSKGAVERQAFKGSKLTIFVLAKPWSKQQYWEKTHTMVRWWPKILAHIAAVEGGMYQVPWGFKQGGRFKALFGPDS